MRNLISNFVVIFFLTLGIQTNGIAQPVIWDTVSTGTVRLAVSNHGSMGLNGIGGANMDFTSSGLDCDPNANVYLYSGGPFIIQSIDSAAGVFSWSTGLYQNDAIAPYSFSPDPSGPPSSHFIGPDGSDAFFTGRFLNWDSTIGMERTYYAPTTGVPNDNFIIVRTDIYPLDGLDHPDLAIGEVTDWKIPSDSNGANLSGIRENMVYLQGSDTGVTSDCQANSDRFGSSAFLGMHTSSEFNMDVCANNKNQTGVYSNDNQSESGSAPNGVLDSASVWNFTGNLTGQWTLVGTPADQRIYSTFVHGYTLTATDTLTIYTAIISQQNGSVTDLDTSSKQANFWYNEHLRCGGVDPSLCFATLDFNGDGVVDFNDRNFFIEYFYLGVGYGVDIATFDIYGDCVIDGKDFERWQFCFFYNPPGMCDYPRLTCCDPVVNLFLPCCVGNSGNVDNDPDDIVDISDLTALIDHLFINFPTLVCLEEANIDGDPAGVIDISDLTVLIDHLFINFPLTAPCQ